jgi:hypothetical protein
MLNYRPHFKIKSMLGLKLSLIFMRMKKKIQHQDAKTPKKLNVKNRIKKNLKIELFYKALLFTWRLCIKA